MSQVWHDDHGHDAGRQRLNILEALVSAIERRREVFDLIEQSENPDVAQSKLSEMLDVDHACALAILDLQTRRLTQQGRRRILQERDSLRQSLG